MLLGMPLSLYLANEVSMGRVVGPFDSLSLVTSKLVALMSFQKEAKKGGVASVNDGIIPDEFTFHYLTVDQIICLVSHLGKWALMAKFDVESAYHNVPVHPSNRFLLRMN